MKRIVIILLILLVGAIGLDLYFDEITGAKRPDEAAVNAPAKPAEQQVQTPPEVLPPVEPQPQPDKPVVVQEVPQPRPLPEKPHSAEHEAALQVAQAVQPDAVPEDLEQMVQSGRISPEAAAAVREWAQAHGVAKVEEIGTDAAGADGSKQTRYRLVSKDGVQDLLLTVETPRDGQAAVSRVEEVAADKALVTQQSDALSVVSAFMEAVRRGDMGAARRMTSGKEVSDATLAGLCMLFEEGDFSMRRQLPIRNMFASENNRGYMVYMSPQDAEAAQSRHIGIELTRDAEKGWMVKAVALDDLLNRYEATAEAEGGMYFPIVKNPQGGDSLVLYFGFNDALLSPRSLRQLKIVASLLRESKGDLSITGHTDDIGTDSYNQSLSERRAEAVKNALIDYGVNPAQISTRGMGKSQPLRVYHTGDTQQTIRTIRSGNRRAEIYLDF